ncbi:MAG: 50S ribosomal protein L19 [Candidatus Omnitrophica bacterium]|nr:50S ribosomal protein L19 [Candidatus Omnitrophota bacterium]MDD4012985.1 50S ribosomal protein L19 [Candidatus Omnitrophota bacterium]
MKQIAALEARFMKKDLPKFSIGDSVDVHFRVKEENKERIQVFSGIVISQRGAGIRESFTVRRISYGEGVERIFPMHSPRIDKVEVTKKGKVRRAKLYYLRGKKGKSATKIKEKFDHKVNAKDPGDKTGE